MPRAVPLSYSSLTLPELQALVEHMPDGVIALDAEDRICLCNPSAARMLNLQSGVVLDRRLMEVVPHRELHQAFNVPIAPEHRAPIRQIAIDCAGQKHLLELTVLPVAPDVDSRLRRIIYLSDASDLARSERIKADFVANASHELRTPLSIMRAAVETLLQTADRLDAHQRRFLEVLGKNVDRLEELAQDLLELARIESSNVIVQPESFDLSIVLAEIEHDFDRALRRRQIEFTTDLELGELVADRKLLKRALSNLVDNAVKFVPSSTGQVAVRSSLRDRLAVIEVQDNGLGIPPQDRERIFERFYQVDKARREGGETGTGLGLAIVKHAMLAMGGSVQLDPAAKQGTLIRLLLPQPP